MRSTVCIEAVILYEPVHADPASMTRGLVAEWPLEVNLKVLVN